MPLSGAIAHWNGAAWTQLRLAHLLEDDGAGVSRDPARADALYQRACQLGDSSTAVSGNLSFADAVARAGARRVVAALWPVSDAASALWVPEFYRALVADPQHDAASALRTAQQRLRATRAFAHPFFWAGFETIERLPLAADEPAS